MNALVNEFKDRLETIKAWRHHLHKHPELSLEEAKTAKYIADLVRSWGYEVVEGIGQYGIVASLTAGRAPSPLAYAPTLTPFRSRKTTTSHTRAMFPVLRICAGTTDIRRCCWRPVSTWPGRATSTVPFG